MGLTRTAFPLALAALFAAATPGLAAAASTQRFIVQLASGLCGANNPANDSSLRRLPSGLKNAGSSNVSVVCSQWGDDFATAPAYTAYVYFRNDRSGSYKVTCTLTMGTPNYSQVASTQTITIAAGATGHLQWTTADYGSDNNMQWVNLQCSVPPAFSMREVGFGFEQEIGA